MNAKDLDELVVAAKLSLESPGFLGQLFTQMTKFRKQKHQGLINRLCTEEYGALSRRLDLAEVQDSCSVRNVLKTRKLAKLLIDEQGRVNQKALSCAIDCIQENLYSLGPDRQFDVYPQKHLLKALKLLHTEKQLRQQLQSISKPFSHPHAEQIIRDTLYLPTETVITDIHARQAALSAWFCFLRQHIGSCFATAPAIIVHDEQPELFLSDISDLLGTGQLKRTFGGIEYAVPLSIGWGAGDLRKPVFFSADFKHAPNYLWQSPGMIAAFEAGGLIKKKTKPSEKIAKSKRLVTEAVNVLKKKGPYFFITVEEVLQQALLAELELTKKDIEEYQKRPRGMVQAGLLLHVPKGDKKGGRACKQFFDLFRSACDAFKSLADNALLRSWEFTVASFAETKIKMARYNLYASLGLGANEPGGIGQCLYAVIKARLDECNAEVGEHQSECERILTQVKYLEGRMRRASTEHEFRLFKTEYQTRTGELYHYEQLRDMAHEKAKLIANLFDDLLDEYDRLFPEYFQEVYDADLHDVAAGPYDDSPAGFRLIYKEGRSGTAQWMWVHTSEEFIDTLTGFFIGTEQQIASLPKFDKVQSEISAITTSIVTHIKTEEFLESAFMRMAIAHKAPLIENPLQHLDKVEKKPWAYTSGGTMGALVSCYFGREEKPTEVERWVEEEAELAVFLIDTMKQMAPKVSEVFLKCPEQSLLTHSPTHAFLLKPGLPLYREAWQSDTFSYTWVRDYFVRPSQRFIEEVRLDRDKIDFLIKHFEALVPRDHLSKYREAFRLFPEGVNPVQFREYFVDTIKTRGLGYLAELEEGVDAALYSLLPLIPTYHTRKYIQEVFEHLPGINDRDREHVLQLYDRYSSGGKGETIMSSKGFRELCQALVLLFLKDTCCGVNYVREIVVAMQELKLAMLPPFVFADTNWTKDYFGFVVNPGTGKLELWRVDRLGVQGSPITAWKQWLDGSRQDRTWGVYIHPHEYRR